MSQDKVYWLIERPVKAEVGWFNPVWLSTESRGRPTESIRYEAWTNDAQKAVRFCRQEDAESMCDLLFAGMNPGYLITEHMDIDNE